MEGANSDLTPEQAKAKANELKRQLLEACEKLGNSLPSNTLDELIDAFGGSDNVAEVGHSRFHSCVREVYNMYLRSVILSVLICIHSVCVCT